MLRIACVCLVASVGVSVAGLAPVALAQSTDTPTISAQGIGQATPKPANPKSEASIKKAVAVAGDRAIPGAIAEAKEYAGKVAAAAGLKLGALVSISSNAFGPYGIAGFGPFGSGRFCSKVHNSKIVTTKTGAHRRVSQPGTHTVCRVPPTISVSVLVTYAVAP